MVDIVDINKRITAIDEAIRNVAKIKKQAERAIRKAHTDLDERRI